MTGDTETLMNNTGPMPVIVKSAAQQVQMENQQTEPAPPPPPQPAPPAPIAQMIEANPYGNKQERGKASRQVIAAIIANLGTINTGLVFGFSAVAIPQLKAADSFIKITESEESWIAALSSASTPIGCILSGIMMDRIGRKKTLLITEIPLILGWLLISVASNIYMIYAGRLLMGFGSGMVGAPARVYTSEVTQPHLRGMLSALAAACISFGVLFQYTLGSFVSWQVLSGAAAVIPTVALITMCLMPESPNYLVGRAKREKAVKSLSQLRSSKYDIQREVDHLQNFAQKNQMMAKKTSFRETIKSLSSPAALKPFAILVIYFMMYQFSGVNTITFYAVQVFEKSGTTWDKNTCTIVMGVIRLLFTIIGSILMRRCGRRPLTFFSSIGCGVSMVCLGVYLQYKYYLELEDPTAIPQFRLFPVVCIFAFTISCTLGYLIVPWVMIGELYPQKVRGVLGGMTTFAAHSFVFTVVKTYPMLSHYLHEHGTFMLYGVISLVGTVFYYFYLPETKGKTLQEIEDYFSGRSTTLKTKKQATPSNFNININTAASEQTVRMEKEKLLLA